MDRQKSDHLIVAMKSVKADGAKGMAVKQAWRRSMSSTGCPEYMEHELKPLRYQWLIDAGIDVWQKSRMP